MRNKVEEEFQKLKVENSKYIVMVGSTGLNQSLIFDIHPMEDLYKAMRGGIYLRSYYRILTEVGSEEG